MRLAYRSSLILGVNTKIDTSAVALVSGIRIDQPTPNDAIEIRLAKSFTHFNTAPPTIATNGPAQSSFGGPVPEGNCA